MDGPYSQGYDYDVWGNLTRRYGWGGEVQGGGAGQTSDESYSYTNNRRTDSGFTYDASGNLTFDGGQHFTYDAAGRQTASHWTNLQQGYDGDGLRVRKSDESTSAVYYLRSSVLGGQVVAEISSAGGWQRGYVYLGSNLLAVQQGGVFFIHEEPITKSKRVTDMSGSVVSAVELDPFGADTTRSANSAFQPKKFTSYERDYNGSDEAMFRRYNRWHSRFDQPDPYEGSYDLTDPQSFNRYAYVQNDPVSFVDPTGLLFQVPDATTGWYSYSSGFWGGGWNFNDRPGAGREIVADRFNFDVREIVVKWSYVTEIEGELGIRSFTDLIRSLVGRIAFNNYMDYTLLPSPPLRASRKLTPQNTTTQNSLPPCNLTGSGDIGFEAITPVFVGPKGGVQLDSRGAFPYFGLAAGTPGKGLAITGGNSPVSPGVSVGFSAAFIVGVSYSADITRVRSAGDFKNAIRNGSWQFGGGTPGASVNITATLAPRFLQRSCR